MIDLTKHSDTVPATLKTAAPELHPLGLAMNVPSELADIFPQHSGSEWQLYVASLSHYNAGKLVGAWLDIEDLDADEISEAITAFLQWLDNQERLRDPANYLYLGPVEEYAIHDSDCPIDIDEWPDFEELCAWKEVYRQHGAFIAKAAADEQIPPESVDDALVAYVEESGSGFLGAKKTWAYDQLIELGCPEQFADMIDLDHAFNNYILDYKWAFDFHHGLVVFSNRY